MGMMIPINVEIDGEGKTYCNPCWFVSAYSVYVWDEGHIRNDRGSDQFLSRGYGDKGGWLYLNLDKDI